MAKAFVLMTALPPTLGHLDLVKFARNITEDVRVILVTQPDEPAVRERYRALQDATWWMPGVRLHHINRELPQEPKDHPGFWDMWIDFLKSFGFEEGDYIVASELYGVKLAEVARGRFIPYDLGRQVRYTKATEVREDWIRNWDQILPEFRRFMNLRVTIFGAESTGKTTLTKDLSDWYTSGATTLPEWARPYLEAVGSELTVQKMDSVYLGQKALQISAYMEATSPILIQDTDLFSTLGYWDSWDKWSLPPDLRDTALRLKSDLYIVTKSNIPFEKDVLRYGGDQRELSDEYWIEILERNQLPYAILDSADRTDRWMRAKEIIDHHLDHTSLTYQRLGEEYETSA